MQCPVHLVRAKTKSSWCQYALAADPQSALLLAVAVNLAGDSLRQEIVFRQCRFAEESVGEAAINNVCRGNLLLKFLWNGPPLSPASVKMLSCAKKKGTSQ